MGLGLGLERELRLVLGSGLGLGLEPSGVAGGVGDEPPRLPRGDN